MVTAVNNNTSVNAIYNNKQEQVKTLVKYVNNEALKDVPDTFVSTAKSAVGTTALFEGIPLLKLMLNKKSLGANSKTLQGFEQVAQMNANALQSLKKGEGSILSRLSDYISNTNKTKEAYRSVRSAAGAEAKINKLSKKLVNVSEKSKKGISEKIAKLQSKVAGKTEVVSKVAETTTKTSSKLGKLGNFMKSKGAAAMLIFSGISECISEIIPTFKELGAKKGIKQIGKSAIKVLGDTVGFIGGEAAGTAVGAAIGTAICPVVGTAIGGAMGAICGFVGGLFGSFAMGKVTKAITGKTEREIAKEESQKQEIQKISSDAASLEELKMQAAAKIQEQAATQGKLDQDSQIALEILNNLETSNPFS